VLISMIKATDARFNSLLGGPIVEMKHVAPLAGAWIETINNTIKECSCENSVQ